MPPSSRHLRFLWWNLQSFAHFDRYRISEDQWPNSIEEYREKSRRIDRALRELLVDSPPDVLAFAEVTNAAITELRDRLLPTYEVLSLDLLARSNLEVAILYDPSKGFGRRPQIAVPLVPRQTRSMAVVDYTDSKNRIRFIACHWTAHFRHASKHTRADVARFLNAEIFSFLHEGVLENRHVVILGDLNEEPFSETLVERLHASRERAIACRREHPTDEDTQRVRLYNCAWRYLGERYAHTGLAPQSASTAGTHYWSKERKWVTFDHVIVTGSLLTERKPYLDESSVEVLPAPSILDGAPVPIKFSWNDGKATGVSDHLPIRGKIVLT